MPSLLSAPGSIFSIIVREKSVSAGVGSGNQERILVIYIGIEKSKISNNDLSFLFQQKLIHRRYYSMSTDYFLGLTDE